jgi:hypothetical protein
MRNQGMLIFTWVQKDHKLTCLCARCVRGADVHALFQHQPGSGQWNQLENKNSCPSACLKKNNRVGLPQLKRGFLCLDS